MCGEKFIQPLKNIFSNQKRKKKDMGVSLYQQIADEIQSYEFSGGLQHCLYHHLHLTASSDLHRKKKKMRATHILWNASSLKVYRGKQFPLGLTCELCLKIQLLQFSISELMAGCAHLSVKLNCLYVKQEGKSM